jgi:hypothetical protein
MVKKIILILFVVVQWSVFDSMQAACHPQRIPKEMNKMYFFEDSNIYYDLSDESLYRRDGTVVVNTEVLNLLKVQQYNCRVFDQDRLENLKKIMVGVTACGICLSAWVAYRAPGLAKLVALIPAAGGVVSSYRVVGLNDCISESPKEIDEIMKECDRRVTSEQLKILKRNPMFLSPDLTCGYSFNTEFLSAIEQYKQKHMLRAD